MERLVLEVQQHPEVHEHLGNRWHLVNPGLRCCPAVLVRRQHLEVLAGLQVPEVR